MRRPCPLPAAPRLPAPDPARWPAARRRALRAFAEASYSTTLRGSVEAPTLRRLIHRFLRHASSKSHGRRGCPPAAPPASRCGHARGGVCAGRTSATTSFARRGPSCARFGSTRGPALLATDLLQARRTDERKRICGTDCGGRCGEPTAGRPRPSAAAAGRLWPDRQRDRRLRRQGAPPRSGRTMSERVSIERWRGRGASRAGALRRRRGGRRVSGRRALRPGLRPARTRMPSSVSRRSRAASDGKPSAVMYFSPLAMRELVETLGPRTREAAAALLPGPVTLVVANPQRRYPLACREDPERLGVRLIEGPLAGRDDPGLPDQRQPQRRAATAPLRGRPGADRRRGRPGDRRRRADRRARRRWSTSPSSTRRAAGRCFARAACRARCSRRRSEPLASPSHPSTAASASSSSAKTSQPYRQPVAQLPRHHHALLRHQPGRAPAGGQRERRPLPSRRSRGIRAARSGSRPSPRRRTRSSGVMPSGPR